MPKIPVRTSMNEVSTRVSAGPSTANEGALDLANATKNLGNTISNIGDMAFKFQEIDDNREATQRQLKDWEESERFKADDIRKNGPVGHSQRYSEFSKVQDERARKDLSGGITGGRKTQMYSDKMASYRQESLFRANQNDLKGQVEASKKTIELENSVQYKSQIDNPDLKLGQLGLENQIKNIENSFKNNLIDKETYDAATKDAPRLMSEGHIEGLYQKKRYAQGIKLMEDENSIIRKTMDPDTFQRQLARFRNAQETEVQVKTAEVNADVRDIMADARIGFFNYDKVKEVRGKLNLVAAKDPEKATRLNNMLRFAEIGAVEYEEMKTKPYSQWKSSEEVLSSIRGKDRTLGAAEEIEFSEYYKKMKENFFKFQMEDPAAAISEIDPEIKNLKEQAIGFANQGNNAAAIELQKEIESKQMMTQKTYGMPQRRLTNNEVMSYAGALNSAESPAQKALVIEQINSRYQEPERFQDALNEIIHHPKSNIDKGYAILPYTQDPTKRRLIVNNISNKSVIEKSFKGNNLNVTNNDVVLSSSEALADFSNAFTTWGEDSSGGAVYAGIKDVFMLDVKDQVANGVDLDVAVENSQKRLLSDFGTAKNIVYPLAIGNKPIDSSRIEEAMNYYKTPGGLKELIDPSVTDGDMVKYESHIKALSKSVKFVNANLDSMVLVYDHGSLRNIPAAKNKTVSDLGPQKDNVYINFKDLTYNASPNFLAYINSSSVEKNYFKENNIQKYVDDVRSKNIQRYKDFFNKDSDTKKVGF
jgi:hypothetical protein